MTLNELGLEYNDIIIVRKMKDISYSEREERIIAIKFRDDRYPNSTNKCLTFSNSTIIKDVLIKYLNETNSIIDLSPDKIFFTSGARLLNSEKYLNKTLSDLNIRNNYKFHVHETNEVIG